jgi:hypothetical protein
VRANKRHTLTTAPKAQTSLNLVYMCYDQRGTARSLTAAPSQRSHQTDGRASRATHSTHSCSLADVCLSVGALARAVACCGGLCWHGVSSGRYLMTNMWEAREGEG